MPIYLRETKTPQGKIIRNLVNVSSKPKFWEKEKIKEQNDMNYLIYQKNGKGDVRHVFSRSTDGYTTTHTLMQKPKKVKHR